MTNLTAEQVAGIVNSGGGPPTGSTTAQWVALARRENSTFTVEKEDYLHSGHWGLWQLSGDLFQPYGTQYGTKENFVNVMKNSPLVQWNVARRLFMDRKWQPWIASGGTPMPSTADKNAATNADNAFGRSGGGDLGGAVPEGIGPTLENLNPIDKVGDFLGQIIDPIRKAAEWVGDPHNWIRVVQVIAGVALGLVAVNLALGNPADTVLDTLKKAPI